ncbi:MAG: enolase [Isosphaeraceae bacterium]|nr:MAG: enolase [Isosphaeraceae bacterium]
MARLAQLLAREVLDSRGRPTVEVDAYGDDGSFGRAIVPSGASTGRHEALELRDRDASRFEGLGVRRAVGHVTGAIAEAVCGRDLADQAGLDAALVALDGTPNKSRLGANALLGVSLAVAHAAAEAAGLPLYQHLNLLWRARLEPGEEAWAQPSLPMPMVNMISGGLHAGSQIDVQDFLIIPIAARSYSEALEWTARVHRALGRILARYGEEAHLVGDEGGYGPRLGSNARALDRLVEAIAAAGLTPGHEVALALDLAATHLYDPATATYRLAADQASGLPAAALIDRLEAWVERYPIVSIEDALAEDDWDGWTRLTSRLGDRVQLIGDDLFVTQTARLLRGLEHRAANAVLIKFNQVGTLSETLATVRLARRLGYRTIVSARSGETEDSTIADLAVATGAGQIKIGSIVRSERLAKYNRLLRIEEQLGGPEAAPFAGWPAVKIAAPATNSFRRGPGSAN